MWWRRGARRMLNISTNGACWALENKKDIFVKRQIILKNLKLLCINSCSLYSRFAFCIKGTNSLTEAQ